MGWCFWFIKFLKLLHSADLLPIEKISSMSSNKRIDLSSVRGQMYFSSDFNIYWHRVARRLLPLDIELKIKLLNIHMSTN